jgi:hypothetical protein
VIEGEEGVVEPVLTREGGKEGGRTIGRVSYAGKQDI